MDHSSGSDTNVKLRVQDICEERRSQATDSYTIGPLTVMDYIDLSDGRYEYHADANEPKVSISSNPESPLVENDILGANHISEHICTLNPQNNPQMNRLESTEVKQRDIECLEQCFTTGQQEGDGPVAPVLPSNKLFHVFFSFSSEDKEWVMNTIQKLEAPPYNFRCCYDERDFQPGVTVLQNIITSVHTSAKTVIVLSPAFVESAWCSYETRVTMEMDLNLRQKLLLPVLLHPCKIPEFVGRLTYLDVRSPLFWQKFVDSLCDLDLCHSSVESLIQPTVNFNPNLYNGEKLVTLKPENQCLRVRFCEEEIPYALVTNGIQMSTGVYQDAVKNVNHLNKYFICKGYLFQIFTALVYLLWLSFAIVVVYTLTEPMNPDTYKNDLSIDIGILVGFFSFTLTILLYYIYQRTLAESKMKKICDTANEHLSFKKVLMLYRNKTLTFFYYDITACKVYLQEHFDDHYQNSYHNISVENPSNINHNVPCSERVEEFSIPPLMKKHMWKYLNLLCIARVPRCDLQRHTVQNMCLCQYIEAQNAS